MSTGENGRYKAPVSCDEFFTPDYAALERLTEAPGDDFAPARLLLSLCPGSAGHMTSLSTFGAWRSIPVIRHGIMEAPVLS